ncbi:hypothetical protein ACRPOS_005805 [Bartonella heixiaziensis]
MDKFITYFGSSKGQIVVEAFELTGGYFYGTSRKLQEKILFYEAKKNPLPSVP